MLALQFLIAITAIRLVMILFKGTTRLLVGDVVLVHPWLFTFFAYLPTLILILVYLNASLHPWKHFGLFKSDKLVLFSIIMGLVAALVLFAIDYVSGGFSTFGIKNNPSLAVAAGWLLVLGLLAPFTEELLFRGVIQKAFSTIKTSYWLHPSILIASIYELLFHIGNSWSQLGYVLVFGIIGGWVFHRTKSLLGPFLIHAIGNAGELCFTG